MLDKVEMCVLGLMFALYVGLIVVPDLFVWWVS
jgi:hypothetical protein